MKNYVLNVKTLIFAMALLIGLNTVSATTFTVSSLANTGAGTLRQAITDANANNTASSGSPHVINFTISGTVNLTVILPNINNHITFNAHANGNTINRSSGTFRLFDISSSRSVIFNNFKFTNGSTNGSGGAIASAGSLAVNNCVFENNNCSAEGGAISANPGLAVKNCLFINNSSSSHGGAVRCQSISTFENSTFKSNSSTAGHVGALYSTGASTVTNCTFFGNTSNVCAGALAIGNGSTMTNCTVINNSCGSANQGGGIYSFGNLSLVNCIVSNNLAAGAANDYYGNGGSNAQTTSIVETSIGSFPTWSSTADPDLGSATICGNQTKFIPNYGSYAIDNGTTAGAPTFDICGTDFGTIDIGSAALSNQWTWAAGDKTPNSTPIYGTKGVAAPGNKPGGRQLAASWVDASGDFWLFGGHGYSANGYGVLNDLWKWDGVNWMWVAGSNSHSQNGVYGTKNIGAGSNNPGGRECGPSWIDAAGNFWLFGGSGYDAVGNSSRLNDLWKWDGTNWTWVSGSDAINQVGVYGTKGVSASANIPGARVLCAASVDGSGNVWLFGGFGQGSSGSGYFNDLWKWDGTNWTWVSGSNAINQAANYGTKGVASGSNIPSARRTSISSFNNSGDLLIFGGKENTGDLNDLWKWDGTNWTWISGDNTLNQNGVYGTKGVPASANKPGARHFNHGFTDAIGNLWIFGGNGLGASGSSANQLNDLWKWDGTNWTWLSGSNSVNQNGAYGTKGITSITNTPGARHLGSVTEDGEGNFWLFGGTGDAESSNGRLNDLWKFGTAIEPIIRTFVVSAQDGDWHTASTWVGNITPVASDSVKVKHEVNVTATTGKVKIDKLVMENADDMALLIINSGDSFIVAKDIKLEGTSATNAAKIAVSGNSIVKTNNLDLENTISGSNVELELNGNAKVIILEDLMMDAQASGESVLDMNAGSNLCLVGNVVRPNFFGKSEMEQGATITYNGSAAQIFTSYDLGAGDLFGHANVVLNNGAGLIMETGKEGALLTDTLTFVNGNITTATADQVIFSGERAYAKDASNANCILGPAKKIGAGAFTFPLGKDGKLGKIGITDPGATGDFSGEYFRGLPSDTSNHVSSIKKISSLESWDLTRNTGTATVFVTLHWERADSAGISDLSDLIVCHYSGGTWKDETQSATTGGLGASSGSITTSNALTSFSPFTFGSSSSGANPLPMELEDFTVVKVDENTANLHWVTLTEINTNYFEVQRSKDGVHFIAIGKVKASGNSNSVIAYNFKDNDLNSLHVNQVYYRLKGVDYDGSEALTRIEVLELDQIVKTGIITSLAPNPFNNTISLNLNPEIKGNIQLIVTDVLGSISLEKVIKQEGSNNYIIDLSTLPNGVYFVSIISNGKKESMKMVKE